MSRRSLGYLVALGALAGCGAGGSPGGSSGPGAQAPAADPSIVAAPAIVAPATRVAPAAPAAPAVTAAPAAPAPLGAGSPRFAVGLRTYVFVEPRHGGRPRRLVTLVRYPAIGRVGAGDRLDAPAQRSAGPFPLVVFGHGFAVTPAPYAALLRAWTEAGYVVAAPVFPYENANAPGGPDESDLINQPGDMSYVITRMSQASAGNGSFLSGLVDGRRIAIAGQSDGGETALAVAYDRYFVDLRVRAAVILSGAQIPGRDAFFHFGTTPGLRPPALLATQGTADVVNLPHFTYDFFAQAPRPKYLLKLFGAPHLGPYTNEQPQLGIVARTSLAFFGAYLRGPASPAALIRRAGDVPGRSAISADR